MEGRERAEYVNRRESCSANKRCIARRKSERKRQRKDGTGGSRGRREIGGRIGWDVQVRQYTKGSPEITIFHSFARSNYFVQLKYRFSPPSPRLSREFAFCSVAHSPSPPLPSALSSPATLHTVTSTVPNPVILPLRALARPGIQPPLSLYRSFFPSLSHRCFLSLSPSPPTLFRLQYSIIGYASARGPFAKSGKRSRLRFLRAHKRARVVSLPSYDCRLTVRPRGGK